jgi:hypothetical protein
MKQGLPSGRSGNQLCGSAQPGQRAGALARHPVEGGLRVGTRGKFSRGRCQCRRPAGAPMCARLQHDEYSRSLGERSSRSPEARACAHEPSDCKALARKRAGFRSRSWRTLHYRRFDHRLTHDTAVLHNLSTAGVDSARRTRQRGSRVSAGPVGRRGRRPCRDVVTHRRFRTEAREGPSWRRTDAPPPG